MCGTTYARCGPMASLIWLAVHGVATAAVLVDKPFHPQYGLNSNVWETKQQIADDIQLSAPAVANHFVWYGFPRSGATSANFRVRVFYDVAGKPEATPYYEHELGVLEGTGTGAFTSLNYQILGFESDIPALTLDSNTTYWITIAATTDATFTWENGFGSIVGSNQYARYGDAGQWAGQFGGPPLDRVDNAFTLSGFEIPEIPEPFTLALLAVEVGAVTIVPRRRRG